MAFQETGNVLSFPIEAYLCQVVGLPDGWLKLTIEGNLAPNSAHEENSGDAPADQCAGIVYEVGQGSEDDSPIFLLDFMLCPAESRSRA